MRVWYRYLSLSVTAHFILLTEDAQGLMQCCCSQHERHLAQGVWLRGVNQSIHVDFLFKDSTRESTYNDPETMRMLNLNATSHSVLFCAKKKPHNFQLWSHAPSEYTLCVHKSTEMTTRW